jgi:hypothetical protein
MNLQGTLDSLRMVLRTQSPRDLYGSNQVATNIYICKEYSSNLQHYFLSKLKFMHNPTLLSVTTPSMIR